METPEDKIARLEQKIDQIYASVEKARKYMLTILIITIVTIVLPILASVFILPMLMSSVGGMYSI